ncbi:MAG TPA: hypothetical protein PLU71_00315 [Candidatus Dependentiae bacterium]|nr:hypothetical protein [Candidatus Dependentiae bacterium]HRQ62281.1 hypothetical protein [Candidatus Dependentiae bacterium]
MYVWLLLGCVISLLPACSGMQHRNIQTKQNTSKKNNRIPTDLIQEQEAKLSDIPIPLNVLPILHFFKDQEISSSHAMLGYISYDMSAVQVAEFYVHEMEWLGWQQVAYFNGIEQQLIFFKPGKICSISVRPSHKKIELVIVVDFTSGSFLF